MLVTIIVMIKPNNPTMANDIFKLDACAIYPIMGGPSIKPKKLMLDTIVRAMPGGTFGVLPATLYTVGTMVDTPNPTSIKDNAAVMI